MNFLTLSHSEVFSASQMALEIVLLCACRLWVSCWYLPEGHTSINHNKLLPSLSLRLLWFMIHLETWRSDASDAKLDKWKGKKCVQCMSTKVNKLALCAWADARLNLWYKLTTVYLHMHALDPGSRLTPQDRFNQFVINTQCNNLCLATPIVSD